jgi:23S rRNA (cytosine1962-C5)-methyltransferase
MLAGLLGELLGPPVRLDRPGQAAARWRVVLRADRAIEEIEGFCAPPADATGGELIIREHGIRYRVDVVGGHKTGFFCDQRENRRRLADFCRDATVLDVCCYTGGFGLAAKLLGGAREVTSIDLDESVVALARQNANLNQARIHYAEADAFIYLRQMIAAKRQFDVVVLDPPKFIASREGWEDGLKKYHDLNKLGQQVVRPGGLLLTCSCSGLVGVDDFVGWVHAAGRSGGRRLQLLGRSGAGPDHPVMLDCPESAYLKAVWLRVF